MLALAPAARANSLPPGCRGSTTPSSGAPQSVNGTTGEGRPYEIRFEDSSGAGAGTTTATVSFGGKQALVVKADVDFSRLAQPVPIAPELRLKDWSDIRSALDTALFHAFCGRPEGSLARLLAPDGKLAWAAGKPVQPGWYAIEREVKKKPEWLYYLGGTHGDAPWEPLDLNAPGAVREGKRVAIPTKHGVAVYDEAGDRHAWVYVNPSMDKLRHPSIGEVRFDGPDTVVVQVLGEKPRRVAIDLKTGRSRTVRK